MKYTLALRTGGLMENPEWAYENIKEVEAESLYEAKKRYAQMTGLSDVRLIDGRVVMNCNWNPVTQTYWGYSIVGVNPLKEVNYE